MGLSQLNFEGKNKVDVALARLKQFEPKEGYYLAFSGGKDSVVLYDLAVKSGVKFDAHHNMISIEPAETVRFIRDFYPDVLNDKPKRSFWVAIITQGYPTRIARWCCKEFKERGGINRLVLTGVRWEESARRGNRKMVEPCTSFKHKWYVHPIIDWHTDEVWEYIKLNNLSYCSLYDEGRSRIGCIMCPMVGVKKVREDMERWPKVALAWQHAFDRLYKYAQERGLTKATRFNSAEEMFKYWLNRKGDNKENGQSEFVYFG